jgi:dihydroorotase
MVIRNSQSIRRLQGKASQESFGIKVFLKGDSAPHTKRQQQKHCSI